MKNFLIYLFDLLGYTVKKKGAGKDELLAIDKGKNIINKISPDCKVLNGPFEGMRYPSINITELTLVPKITGSYEIQLMPVINQIIRTPYNNILDIGCAEGYYGVGFAMKMPDTLISCFDINQKDLDFCKSMAVLNNVSNLTYNNFCSPETLMNFKYGGRSLIFCDCEGYELELFSSTVVDALHSTDVLIELHDVINPVISATLLQRFERSHNVILLNNSNVNYSQMKGLDDISPAEKAFAVYEHRGGLFQNIFMEWAFFTSKKSADGKPD